MAKDTFYFSHDYNSRADEKIKLLIRKHGILGYGTFWAIIEDLYNNANAMRTDYEGIAYDLRVDTNIVKSVINDFDLFIIKDDFFGSLSVQRRLDDRNAKSKKASNSANYRWSKSKDDANAMRTQCDSNAIKERKGNEIKESKQITNTIYSFDEFWETYNKKTGRVNCERIYARLKDKDYDKIKETLPIYLERLKEKDKKYQMNPQTYLNGKYWEDEIFQEAKTTQQNTTQSGKFELIPVNYEY